MSPPHLLILAGTAEARALAEALARWPVRVTVSLAGATRRAAPFRGDLRTGGFGGAEGMAQWLARHGVSLVIDATHPFAARISANAAAASRQIDCPLLRLERPAWQPHPGDHWQHFGGIEAALAALPMAARPFLATGSGSREALASRRDVPILLRAIEPAALALPAHVTEIISRPPHPLAGERALMEEHRITHLVTRNAGGEGRAKLDAARALGLPVFMIERPVPPPGVLTVPDLPGALAWIGLRLALDSGGSPAP